MISRPMRVYAIIDTLASPDHPLGDAVETFVRREDAERFVQEVRGDDPELASYLRIEEREWRQAGTTSPRPSFDCAALLFAPIPVAVTG